MSGSTEQILNEKCLKDDLGEGNVIFVGSSTDMFAEGVPDNWIYSVLKKCREHNNTYLFQTKNPKKFIHFLKYFPKESIFGTTFESNLDWKVSKAPQPCVRMEEMKKLKSITKFPLMVSMEPILKFDLEWVIDHIKPLKPKFVSIGADSKGHNLPEPSSKEVEELIKELEKFTEVKIKPNLKRILKS